MDLSITTLKEAQEIDNIHDEALKEHFEFYYESRNAKRIMINLLCVALGYTIHVLRV